MGDFCSRLCTPPNLNDDENATGTSPKDKVDAYQAMLTNYMTVSTLLLGFIVTGTMLSMLLTGEENFDSSQLIRFTYWAGGAAILSMISLIIAFLVSGRGTQVLANSGGKQALKSMRRQTLWIALAELLIFGSLCMFAESTREYLEMTYMGPDICPAAESPDEGTIWGRSSSFCALLGSDLYGAAGDACATNSSAYPSMCAYYAQVTDPTWIKYYGDDDEFDGQYRFGWGNSFADTGPHTQGALKDADDLVNLLCQKDKADDAKQALCAGAGANTPACAQARMGFIMADNCAGGKQDDVDKCNKVCAWKNDYRPSEQLALYFNLAMYPMMAILGFVMFVRVLLMIRQQIAVCRWDKASMSTPFISEFVDQNSSSDDDYHS